MFELDNFSFCVELGLSLAESKDFKEMIDNTSDKEYDRKKLNIMSQMSSRLKDNYRGREY